jgi:hypothetical protein
MVKKLFKHEINAYLRVMSPVYACLLGVALIGRIIQIFEADTTIYELVNGSSIFVYIISLLVCFGFSSFFSIVRFYKNLFTGEGYLTFTLPVTPTEHLYVKLLTSVLFGFISTVAVSVSCIVITFGDIFKEIINAIAYLLDKIIEKTGIHFFLYLFEFLIGLFLSACFSSLLFYMCIAIGQLSKKNRVLCAVGVYFAYYFVSQIIGTIFGIVFTVLADTTLIGIIVEFAGRHPFAFIHIILCLFIVITAVVSFIFFLVTRSIMTKKLNLE